MGLSALFRRKPHERAGFELYGKAVAAARDPCFSPRSACRICWMAASTWSGCMSPC